MGNYRKQSKREEIFNGASHGMALIILMGLMPVMYQAATVYKNGQYAWTLLPFYFGILTTYSSSTIYHFSKHEVWKDRWRIIDHISIFLLIGGTYTPVIMQYVDDPIRLIFLGIMWTIILIGAMLKFWWTGKYDNFSTGFYVFLGWMLIFVIWPIWNNAPWIVLIWILAGGICYSVGVYFYKKSSRRYYHVIWHALVFGGTLCHWMAIYYSFK